MVKMGYQLSSVTPYLDTAEHIRSTFQKIAGIGYRYVQLQGVPIDIQDDIIADALNKAGLKCIATQEDYVFGFGDDPDWRISRAVCCGAKYLCCALMPRDIDSVEKLKQFAERLSEISEKVQAAGLIFTYHPIGGDFRLMDGQPIYARLFELLPKEVQMTFCVNSAFSAGVNPQSIFSEYAGRMDLVHFKDDAPTMDGGKHLMPLGQGTHDWIPIVESCEQAGVKYIFTEQERWLKDAFECAKDSFEYLAQIGVK